MISLISLISLSIICSSFLCSTFVVTAATTAPTTSIKFSSIRMSQQHQQQLRRRDNKEQLFFDEVQLPQVHHQPTRRHLQDEEQHDAGVLGPGAGVGGQHWSQMDGEKREDELHAAAAAVSSSGDDSDNNMNNAFVIGSMIVASLVLIVSLFMLIARGSRRFKDTKNHNTRLSELQFSNTLHELYNKPMFRSSGSINSSISSFGADSFGGDEYWEENLSNSGTISFKTKDFLYSSTSDGALKSSLKDSLKSSLKVRPTGILGTGTGGSAVKNKESDNKKKKPSRVSFGPARTTSNASSDLSDLL